MLKTAGVASQYKFLGTSLKAWAIILLGVPLGGAVLLYVAEYIPALDTFLRRLFDPSGPAKHSWDLAFARLQEMAPRVSAWVFSIKAVQDFLSVAFAPGFYAVDAIWTGLLRQRSNPFLQNPFISLFFMLVMVGVPWVFWSTVLSRALFYLGIWNPFYEANLVAIRAIKKPVWGSRRWVLMGLVKLRDTWEIVTRFGRAPTGGWAGFIEVLSNKFLTGDVFLGRPKLVLGGMLRPIGLRSEKHMVTIAGTGSGKSTAALIPNLCIHPGSLLCIDPKGELATITARRRGPGGRGVAGMGQDTHVLDPFGIVHGWRSSSYNVFEELARVSADDPDRAVSYADTITAALYMETSIKEPFWDTAAQNFLVALILYVFSCEPESKRNLVHLRYLVMTGGDGLLDRMARAGGPYGERIATAASAVRSMPENTRGSVRATLETNTAFIGLPEFERISQRSDFVLSDLKNYPLSVYLCLPINQLRGKGGRWLRMFVLLLIDIMMRSTKKPDPPILLAVDEFPSLGHLDGIETVAPVMRSYGVRFWAIAQDIEQLEKVYPGVWGGFVGGAEAVQFMGVTHPPTVAYIVERLGEHVVRKRVRAGGRTHWEEEERDLLDADQVSRILASDRKNQIIWRGSKKPLMLKTAPYFWYMPSKYYDQDPRYKEAFRHRVWRGWLSRRSEPLGPARSGPQAPVVVAAPPEQPPQSVLEQVMAQRDTGTAATPLTAAFPPAGAAPTLRPAKSAAVTPEFSELLKMARTEADVPMPGYAPPKESDPLQELNAMVGLDAVKQEVGKLVNLMKLHAKRKQHGMPDLTLSHHLVFTGNPGTGKTTVARLIGRVYKEFGILKSGHVVEVDRGGLVASYTGQTPPKVMEVVEKALDGILFIDEAYSLTPKEDAETDHYGAEAVATLLKAMEDNRERLAVVVAGYPEEMKRFIRSNPGLESRFKTVIDFPDYGPDELTAIFDNMCAAAGCRLSMAARSAVGDWLAYLLLLTGKRRGFGNGRAVRNLFEDCVARQAGRLAAKADVSKVDVTMLEAEDIPALSTVRYEPRAPQEQGDGDDDAPPVMKPPRGTAEPAPAVSEEKIKEILSWSDEVAKTAKRKRGRPKKDET